MPDKEPVQQTLPLENVPNPNEVPEVNVDEIIAKWSAELPDDEAAEEASTEETGSESESEEAQPSDESEEPSSEEGEEEGKEAEQEGEEAEEEEPSLQSKQLAQLARREKAVREQADQVKQAQQQLQQFQQQLYQQAQQLEQALQNDLAGTLRKLGKDPAQVAYDLWAAELGDDAPDSVKQQVRDRSVQARLDAMERQFKAQQEQAQRQQQEAVFQAQVQTYDNQLKGFAQQVPEDLGFLHTLSREDPTEVYQALATAAVPSIKAGTWPSVNEVAKAVEAELRADWERLSPKGKKQGSAETPKEEGKKRKKAKTLSDADMVGKKRDPKSIADMDRDEAKRRALEVARKYGAPAD